MDKDDKFRALYERHYGRVVRKLLAFGFSQDETRDLAQDVFLKLYRTPSAQYSGQERAFIERLVRSSALSMIRDRAPARRVPQVISVESAEATQVEDARPSQEDEAIEKEHRQQLYRAIAELAPELRVNLLLSLRGFTHHEIAEALAISVTAVKFQLNEARRRLRERLGEELAFQNERPLHAVSTAFDAVGEPRLHRRMPVRLYTETAQSELIAAVEELLDSVGFDSHA